jgi:hypothetical protein
MTISNEQLIAVLEDMILNGKNQAARLSAIKELRSLRAEVPAEAALAGGDDPFAELDEADEFAPRRSSRGSG